MTGLTQQLCTFVAGTSFNDLPEKVIQKVKGALLDSIGCALASQVTGRAQIITEFIADQGGKPEASIIGSQKTCCASAAFANGELINAMDYDAVGPIVPHVVPYVMPPVLALGERVAASGKDMITGLALALEVGGRMGSALPGMRVPKEQPPYYEYSPRESFSPTIFGAVAGACKTLGLDTEQIANAFGIAGVSTPVAGHVKWEHAEGPVIMTKYNCWSGWIAQLGTTAALLSERGFAGDTTILDGEWGFWKMYGSPFFKGDKLTYELGKVWYLENLWFKLYPCCALNHSAIEAISMIVEQNRVAPEDIERITVEGDPLFLMPLRTRQEIVNFGDTQFCNAYIFAAAVFHGQKPSPSWQIPATYRDPRIVELMKKVKVVQHPNTETLIAERIKAGLLPAFFDVRVQITAKGKSFSVEAKEPKGSPASPLSDEQIRTKFRENATYSSLESNKVEAIIETIAELERVENIRELAKLVTID